MNRTPTRWRTDTSWKYGPTRVVLTGERPDPMQLPETAGEQSPPARRSVHLTDFAVIASTAAFLGALYLLADWLVKIR